MIMIIAALSILCFAIYVYSTNRAIESYYPTIFVFSITGIMYFLAVPIEQYIIGNESVTTPMGALHLTPEFQLKLSANAITAVLMFYLGYKRKQKELFNQKYFESRKSANVLSVYLLPIIILAVLFIGFTEKIIASEGYVNSYTTLNANSTYSFLVSTILVVSSVAVYYLLQKKMSLLTVMIALIYISINISWMIYTYDRDSALMALLACGAIVNKVRLSRTKEVAAIAFAIFAILAVFQYISYSRAGIRHVEFNMGDVAFARSDANGVFFSIAESIEKDTDYGWDKFELAYILIPKFVWPQRPNGIAERFAKKYMRNWKPGEGFAYSMLAESYMTFGIIGVAIHYYIFGLLWGLVWNAVKKIFRNTMHFRAIYFVLGYNLLILCQRYTTGGIAKKFVHVMAIYVVAVVLIDYVIFDKKLRNVK